jgi:hypothetical protein
MGLELAGRRADGTEFPIEVSLTFVRTDEGEFGLAFVTDITERRALEPTARQTEKFAALATLSAGVAHELNNPLRARSPIAADRRGSSRPASERAAGEPDRPAPPLVRAPVSPGAAPDRPQCRRGGDVGAHGQAIEQARDRDPDGSTAEPSPSSPSRDGARASRGIRGPSRGRARLRRQTIFYRPKPFLNTELVEPVTPDTGGRQSLAVN